MRKLVILSTICLFNFCTTYGQASDLWYIVNLGGKPVGFYRETTSPSSDGVSTQIQMKLKISRLGSETNMESKQMMLEKGQALKLLDAELKFSEQTTKASVVIEPSSIKLTMSAGGKESKAEIPYTGILAGNEAIRLQSLERLKKQGDSMVFKTFVPDFGMVVQGTRKYVGEEHLEINGKIFRTFKVKDTYKELPTVRISWLDDKHRLLKSSEPNPFGQMTLVLSDEKVAMTVISARLELSEDQYTSTLARSNVRLPQPRQIESVTIKIKHKNPALGFPDFTGKYQRVLEKKDDYVVLKITSPKIGEGKETIPATIKNQFIESSFFLDTKDTLVMKQVKEIVGSEQDPWKKVKLIRTWVNKNMKFNAGIALAPSSEVIRNMEGTCVSFGTITTTLYRAAGIPARYSTGYVYADGMWGGHVWAEVYVNETWIPVDAVMTSPKDVADAARFHFARMAGNNGLGEFLMAGAQLYSNVDIEILEYKLNDKVIKTTNKLYTVNEVGYNNPGLGLSIAAMNGFEFKDTDKIYPESILLSMVNIKSGEYIRLYQESISPRSDLKKIAARYLKENKVEGTLTDTIHNGSKAIKASSGSKSIMAILNGADVFVLIAEGDGLLTKALSKFKFQRFSDVEL